MQHVTILNFFLLLLVLDTLYFGLPLEVWKMGVLLVVVSAVVIAVGVPLMLDFLDEHCKKTVHQS